MFEKLKQMKKVREVQKALESKEIIHERDGVKVVMGGNLTIKEIIIRSDVEREKLGIVLKDCLNEAIQKVQIEMAKEMSSLGAF